MHDVVPDRLYGALIVNVVRLDRHVGHSRVRIDRTNRVADRFVLLDHREVTLVIFRATLPAIEQKLCQRDVMVALTPALELVDETAEAHERLLHFLVSVEPLLLWWRSYMVRPA